MKEEVEKYISDNKQRFIDTLLDSLRIPSVSAENKGCEAMVTFLQNKLEKLKFTTRIFPSAGWPFVYGERLVDPNALTILFYGHYDVQPAGLIEKWHSAPFEPVLRDGRIYCRGVADNKGQHMAQLLAVETLLATANYPRCNIKFLLEGEEETNSPYIASFVEANKNLLKSDLVITSDGSQSETGTPKILFGCRGMISFDLIARGANRDLHSGKWGGIISNPLDTLVQALATIKDNNRIVRIPGFYEDIEPLSASEKQALSLLEFDEEHIKSFLGVQSFEAPSERRFAERTALWPVFTINGIHGGYGGDKNMAVLPSIAIAKCEVRLVPNQSPEKHKDLIKAFLKKIAPDIEVIFHGAMSPSKTPMESEFVSHLVKAVTNGQGQAPALIPPMGASLPEYVFTKILGIPSFTIPYANYDSGAHGPNENLSLVQFFKGITTGVSLIEELGSFKKNIQ